MLQRSGTAKSSSGVSSAQALPVMLLRQVRNGTSSCPVAVQRHVAVHHAAHAQGGDAS